MTAPATLRLLTLHPSDFYRWISRRGIELPPPLDLAGATRWAVPFDEQQAVAAGHRLDEGDWSPSDTRVLESVATLLTSPSYAAYATRAPLGYGDEFYVALARGDEAVLVLDTPARVRLACISPSQIAYSLASQLPRLTPARTGRVEVTSRAATAIAGGFTQGASARSVASAMAQAGVPDVIARRLLAGERGVVGTGIIGALSLTSDPPAIGLRSASWTETADGALVSSMGRRGETVLEPYSVPVLSRAITDALTSLNAVRTGRVDRW